MNSLHCANYDSQVCPKDCKMAIATKALMDRWKMTREHIPCTFTHFRKTKYCPMNKELS